MLTLDRLKLQHMMVFLSGSLTAEDMLEVPWLAKLLAT